ncbi:unnamed protein product [Euphydryas editha]|uniref:Uncharacterized protein n=1 Tax=Euphydryas editha TaxID=104508 RepID=A0AAU9VCY5_EUPED|nr:unnamed protein product [Euphydryas editha]
MDLGRKHLYSGGLEGSVTETGAGVARAGKSRLAVKRGRAPTLISARVALRERMKRDREDGLEVAFQMRDFCKQKEVGGLTEEAPIELEDVDRREAEELMVASEAKLNLILGLAGKSMNLKGRYAAKIRSTIASGLLGKCWSPWWPALSPTRFRRLRADNSRLSRDLDLVREEVRAYRREFENSHKKSLESSNTKGSVELMHEIAHMVGNIVDGCLAALHLPAAIHLWLETARRVPQGLRWWKRTEGRWTLTQVRWRWRVRRSSTPFPKHRAKERGRARVKKPEVSAKLTKKESLKPKLALPHSAAVIINLRPEAAARGATYRSALLKAETSVDFKELEIGPLWIRQSATGARLIEVPSSISEKKADALATRLREALAEDVEVLRPEKKAELRISGLSDPFTAERLAIAVTKEEGHSLG